MAAYASEVLTFQILSGGKRMPSELQVYSVVIKQVAHAVDEAIITLLDGDVATESFTIADSKTFAVGASIEIALGYDSKNKAVFKGQVCQQKISITGETGALLHVTCTGDRVRHLDLERITAPVLSLAYGIDVYEAELATNKKEPSSVNGSLRVLGSNKVAVNDRVGLTGFGKRLSKTSLVTGVLHDIVDGNWFTTVTVD